MKANKRTEDSCYESDEQHSSKQNLDLNNNKYQRELQKRIKKKIIQVLAMNLMNSIKASQIEIWIILWKQTKRQRILAMNLMTAFRQENLDLNNINYEIELERKNTTSCSESD